MQLKLLLLLFCLCLLGCATLPEPPDKGAIYRTSDETYTVENTTPDEFCNQMVHNTEIIEGKYRDGENITKLEKTDE